MKTIYIFILAVFLITFPCLQDYIIADSGNIAFAAHSKGKRMAHTERLKGRVLKPGDTIGILAPGAGMQMEDMKDALNTLKRMGYRVKIAPSCTSEYGYFAGTDEQRAMDINRFFLDDEVDGILCVRGGYGAARTLEMLDYDAIRKHPKQFIGFSDVTVLHAALGEKANLATIHGPMLISLGAEHPETDFTESNFFKGIQGKLYPGEIPMPEGARLKTINPGEAEGIIIGGNLSVLTSIVGTPYELKGDGALLFLEDVDEYTYRVDRMLQQLWQNGLLKRVNGVILGDFSDADQDYDGHDFLLDEVLSYYAKLTGKPWIKGVPAGHVEDNLYLPFGVRAKVSAGENGRASLAILEQPLKAANH